MHSSFPLHCILDQRHRAVQQKLHISPRKCCKNLWAIIWIDFMDYNSKCYDCRTVDNHSLNIQQIKTITDEFSQNFLSQVISSFPDEFTTISENSQRSGNGLGVGGELGNGRQLLPCELPSEGSALRVMVSIEGTRSPRTIGISWSSLKPGDTGEKQEPC